MCNKHKNQSYMKRNLTNRLKQDLYGENYELLSAWRNMWLSKGIWSVNG